MRGIFTPMVACWNLGRMLERDATGQTGPMQWDAPWSVDHDHVRRGAGGPLLKVE